MNSRKTSIPKAENPLWTIRIDTAREFTPLVEELMQVEDLDWSLTTPEDNPGVSFEIYLHDKITADRKAAQLAESLKKSCTRHHFDIKVDELPAEDWSESWKRHFRAEQVSRRVVVTPPWGKPGHEEDTVIVEINPGMSFGTGLHFTTRSCLALIDELCEDGNSSFCDLGCGSGILSIAAAKLGYKPVFAMDNDMIAVETTIENLKKNGVGKAVKCVQADLADFQTDSHFDLVVANILAGTLLKNASTIAELLVKSLQSRLILSGIDEKHLESVKEKYGANGFEILEIQKEESWATILMAPGADL